MEDDSVCYSGTYIADINEKVRHVKIEIGICTFKRDVFIERKYQNIEGNDTGEWAASIVWTFGS